MHFLWKIKLAIRRKEVFRGIFLEVIKFIIFYINYYNGYISISALDTLIADAMSRDPESKEWKCNYCAKSHKDKARIKRHVEVHFPGHTQLCPYCQKECNSRNSLRVHISDYHKHIHNNLIINNL